MENKKKVLFLMPQLGEGGGERVIATLIRYLSELEWQPYLYLLLPNGNNEYLEYIPDSTPIFFRHSKIRFRYDIFNIILNLRRLILRNEIDTVFIGSGTLNAYISMFRIFLPRRVKFVVRETNLVSIYEKSSFARFLYAKTYSTYDKIIVQSSEMYQSLLDVGVDKNLLLEINNPVDIELLEYNSSQCDVFCFINNNKKNIVSFGRFTYQKGFDQLIQQIAEQEINEYNFYIFGGGDEREYYQSLINKYKLTNVYLHEFQNNPHRIIKQADLLLSPSRWEGYPNIVVESILIGTPVLANNYPGGISQISSTYNCTLYGIDSNLKESIPLSLGRLPNRELLLRDNKNILHSYLNVL
ncbi:hypothetical protein BCT47_20925 [Vibrio splendidus]|uniref:Glycosyltransferase n=1 Tax=Vibrio splendidus TaxID=29497 RepID=A0AB35N2D2_VIBSP|nr:glycosyltransferase [Vibrio splendidus]MDP2502848.1 glycosyltransferase [Vibrio splendidus]PMM74651.1 hypothetical protein BCT47_20925 [Vibrio splendidus]